MKAEIIRVPGGTQVNLTAETEAEAIALHVWAEEGMTSKPRILIDTHSILPDDKPRGGDPLWWRKN
jgi:hypothetical protein